MFMSVSAFNQNLSVWCIQSNFDSKPTNFKLHSGFENKAGKQPNWAGANGAGANCP
tara:strand:- start:582 stop:749 length:168 start_codon:yes stop_codon:yes gene_type:complete